jgi:hypothetical protein
VIPGFLLGDLLTTALAVGLIAVLAKKVQG